MASMFVAIVMGEGFQQEAETELNLGTIVNTQVREREREMFAKETGYLDSICCVFCTQIKSCTPVLLCSVTGFDASSRVDDLATQQGKQCTRIAIGSAEGFSLAEKAISSASKSGR